ncbi:YwqG family protein [Neorhizobium galegae]|uniref:YwqG family protein n=1 Tax=Neorhizobium galegae TaxID=399 RepID=UPI002100B180|nr:YwqG family protein [Neorhizobium galegae]MCQ1574241.1 YwqG family protein [Neorhizobium galegae]MCQ1837621.1 YwqG family protein [Neorhizobium galegae]
MFGITGVRSLPTIQKMAAEHAAKNGWFDIAAPGDWFILVKLASGGEADFSFGDHGDYIFIAHRTQAAKGDFSRVYAFVEAS